MGNVATIKDPRLCSEAGEPCSVIVAQSAIEFALLRAVLDTMSAMVTDTDRATMRNGGGPHWFPAMAKCAA
ncbi:hypothetical protein BGM19_38665 [Streptomyces agglomeratus]|uniref:Uncharacterized protein n=1 Tax=Streptomyces agglomeratus TaxID=285458 RepID=A0A1E5NYK9_9ACTN|nr:hypothetical protein [Streptomyces agglomeratus]OEJ21405.1 hypothetical protein AS594_38175 [Streptomyces agglomeratus]OEJ36405.1 hypothetical protein BGK72_37395 [Streptomyces agglomeratus]OEJ56266.1 hypothetical protein BGM19_39110 [Streptomyces agglomeratus]OEJ56574.1 hypothetical protein BGM19_38665 [Streptomyces agglomeratus]